MFFCGPYRGAGEVMPIAWGNPFSDLNYINSELADKMRKWVKLMCKDAEELNLMWRSTIYAVAYCV